MNYNYINPEHHTMFSIPGSIPVRSDLCNEVYIVTIKVSEDIKSYCIFLSIESMNKYFEQKRDEIVEVSLYRSGCNSCCATVEQQIGGSTCNDTNGDKNSQSSLVFKLYTDSKTSAPLIEWFNSKVEQSTSEPTNTPTSVSTNTYVVINYIQHWGKIANSFKRDIYISDFDNLKDILDEFSQYWLYRHEIYSQFKQKRPDIPVYKYHRYSYVYEGKTEEMECIIPEWFHDSDPFYLGTITCCINDKPVCKWYYPYELSDVCLEVYTSCNNKGVQTMMELFDGIVQYRKKNYVR